MEVEGKYRLLSPTGAEQIEALDWSPYELGSRHAIDQHDTFFDTPDLDLSRTRHAVRLRDGDRTVVTLKGPGTVQDGVHSRPEIELPTEDRDPAGWPPDIREQLDTLIGKRDLQPILAVHNQRRVWPLLLNGQPIGEVALDDGTIEARGRVEPMHELEIELKGGTPDDLVALIRSITHGLAVAPEDRTKFERGLALLLN